MKEWSKVVANKVIFLDFDGPMIPTRAYWLPNQTRPIVSIFDPVAVSLVNKLLEESQAQLVISSSWRNKGLDTIKDMLTKNGMDPSVLHEDWETPQKFSSQRIHDIKWWLDDHPEVTHYVAIDDIDLDVEFVPNAVLAGAYEGFSFRNYLEARGFLDAYNETEEDQALKASHEELILFLKKKAVWSTQRRSEVGYSKVSRAVDLLFPK